MCIECVCIACCSFCHDVALVSCSYLPCLEIRLAYVLVCGWILVIRFDFPSRLTLMLNLGLTYEQLKHWITPFDPIHLKSKFLPKYTINGVLLDSRTGAQYPMGFQNLTANLISLYSWEHNREDQLRI